MAGLTPHRRNLEVVCRQMRHVVPFYLGVEVDMQGATELRERFMQSGQRITFTSVVLKAIAMSLDDFKTKYPLFNSHYLHFPIRRIVPVQEIRGAIMVAREIHGEDYSFACTIDHPQRLSLKTLSERLSGFVNSPVEAIPQFRDSLRLASYPKWIQRLAFFILGNSISLRERYYGTFWLTTIGKFGPDLQIPPTMGLSFAFGSIRDRVVAVSGKPVVRPTMILTVSLDRRIFNGAPGAELLVEIKRKLEFPEVLGSGV